MNIAYLIWIEQLESPIIKGQVIDILKKISMRLKVSEKLYLISFQLLFFRPYTQVHSRLKGFDNLKKKLRERNISLITIPVLGIPRTLPRKLFNTKWHVLPLVFLQTFPILFFLSIIKNLKIFHCRSYPITLSAILVKKFRKIKVIFDPRSDFPEENITSGQWTNNSLSYKMWKYIEKKYLKESDATVAIVNTYKDHFSTIFSKSKLVMIPNNVDVEKFKRNEEFRQCFREQNNIEKNKLVFCYCGSLGNKSWHKFETYANYIIKFRELNELHCFLFITSDINGLKRSFDRFSINQEEYFAINSSFSEVPKYLSVADVGIVFLDNFKIAMAIKTIEYLSIGLPIITNSNVGGAKEVVEQNGVGLTFDLDSDIGLLDDFIHTFLNKRDIFISQCRDVACRTFSNAVVSNHYFELYRKLQKY